jgi:hypothetical protein
MATTASSFTCATCHRIYHRKSYYSRHVLLCEIMNKSVKERQLENEERADTPSVRGLYEIVLELTKKMNAMDQRLQELAKWTDVKKRKINILDWLNANPEKIGMIGGGGSFETFMLQLKVTRRHLDYLFRSDYTSSILHILQENLPLEDGTKANVIKAYEQKTNILYVYTQGQWIIATEQMFQTLLYVVDKKLLGEFIKWQTENAVNMADDDFALKYAVNVKKIMGNNLSREQIYSRVKIDLYKYLKVCLRNITECEFV